MNTQTHTHARALQPKEEERKRENNQFVYAVLQISFDAWDKTFNNKIKRRTLNGKTNDNLGYKGGYRHEENKARKTAHEKLKKKPCT